ncbi:unnamed protein product [Rotaria sordida]|uniref:Uncharacterized protein n=1 Tax=Rotaria sordida TaxID=392033 RepID=A0A816AJT3_9BILA|nr:unnamed protein product [Rotaria sordida]CAF1598574.1 unnamed protein product [Rotaria sordida]
MRGCSAVFLLLHACTHPYLLDAPQDANAELIINEELITNSGQFILLDKMLVKLSKTNYKVLIFSILMTFLDVLEAICEHQNYDYIIFDGNKNFEERIDANPMIDIQEQDRAYCIGQTKLVVVYRFIVRNTIDEHVSREESIRFD